MQLRYVLAVCGALLLLGCQAAPAGSRAGAPAAAPAATRPAVPPAAAASPPPAPQRITVAYVAPSEAFALPWIAHEAGLFAKYGLEANLVLLTGSPRLVQSLVAGDFEFGLAGVTAMIRARLQGADVAILAATSDYSTQRLLVHPQANIQRVQDLRGKLVGVSQYGSEADTYIRIVLSRAGIPADAVQILQMGGHPQTAAALASGHLDAGVLAGAPARTAEQAGAVRLQGQPELQILAPEGTLATTRRYIEREPEVVRRFMRAYVEAVHFLTTERARAIEIMRQYMADLSPEEVGYLYEQVREVIKPVPAPSEEAIQAVLDRESDPQARSLRPADFTALSFLQELEASGFVAALYR
ncbi:MAG TPA: ABC transporter substrate-binding protein [Chloroflexota bacterium]|jgi:NitT/TauT family transport system substrate-binding protein|nr:ABC transporter substrate-binding protein [Chloroflexota bacterium]